MIGKITSGVGAAVLLAVAASPTVAVAADRTQAGGSQSMFTVTVKNLSTPTTLKQTAQGPKPVPLSPGAYAVYSGGQNPIFVPGQMATKALESIAEDGFPMAEAALLKGVASVSSSGVFQQPAGPKPAILPGQEATFSFSASPGEKLSLATMFVPSNDWFYGPANGIALFDSSGSPVSGDVTSQIGLYDSGTEVNQQFFGSATKPVQPRPDFGTSESQPIQPASQTSHPDPIPSIADVLSVSIMAAPAGGVQAGAGGTADQGGPSSAEVGAAALAGALALAGVGVWVRRRSLS